MAPQKVAANRWSECRFPSLALRASVSRQFQWQRRQLTIGETTTGDVAMKRADRRALLIALFTLALTNAPAVAQQSEPADFVLQGGKVFTLDGNDTEAQAVAIRGGKIVL